MLYKILVRFKVNSFTGILQLILYFRDKRRGLEPECLPEGMSRFWVSIDSWSASKAPQHAWVREEPLTNVYWIKPSLEKTELGRLQRLLMPTPWSKLWRVLIPPHFKSRNPFPLQVSCQRKPPCWTSSRSPPRSRTTDGGFLVSGTWRIYRRIEDYLTPCWTPARFKKLWLDIPLKRRSILSITGVLSPIVNSNKIVS